MFFVQINPAFQQLKLNLYPLFFVIYGVLIHGWFKSTFFVFWLIQVAKEGGEKWKSMTDEVSSDQMFWNTLKRVLNTWFLTPESHLVFRRRSLTWIKLLSWRLSMTRQWRLTMLRMERSFEFSVLFPIDVWVSLFLLKRLIGFCVVQEEGGSGKEADLELIDDE